MRHLRLILAIVFGLTIGLPVIGGMVLVFAANSPDGRSFIANTLGELTQQRLSIQGLEGNLPTNIQMAQVIWQDQNGKWTIDQLNCEWNPWRLWHHVFEIRQLHVGKIHFLPPANKSYRHPEAFTALPLAITVHDFSVDTVDLTELSEQPLKLALAGHFTLTSLSEGDVELSLMQLQSNSKYHLSGYFDNGEVHARLAVNEPEPGLSSMLLGLKDTKPLALTASIEGPLAALRTTGNLSWGKLSAQLQGTLDTKTWQANWQLSANAPAMQAHAGLAWQSLSLFGTVQGELAKPSIHSNLDLKGLQLARTGIGHLNVSVQGDTGQLELTGELNRLTQLAAPKDFLLEKTLVLQASLRLDQAGQPLLFNCQHPLLGMTGKVSMAPSPSAQIKLSLPNLEPLAALAGLTITGSGQFNLSAQQQNQALAISHDGVLAITGGDARFAKVLGKTEMTGAVLINGDDISISRWHINSHVLNAQAEGILTKQSAQLDWQIGLTDLAIFSPKLSGKMLANGQLSGPLDDLSVAASMSGDVATPNFSKQAMTAKLNIEHLPKSATGQFAVNAVLAGAPLQLAASVKPQADQSLAFAIDRADWKSLHAQGQMTLAKQQFWPTGKVAFTMQRVQDLRSVFAHPFSGAVNATLKTSQQGHKNLADVTADAHNLTWMMTATSEPAIVEHTQFSAMVINPLDNPRLSGRLNMDGLAVNKITGESQLDFSGTPAQLGLQWSAKLHNIANEPIDIHGVGQYASNKTLAVTAFQAIWREQQLRLLSPTTISLGDTLAVQDLRMGLGEAQLQVDGQINPVLNISAHLQPVSLALLSGFFPQISAAGTLSGDARLHGTISQPTGDIILKGNNLRLLSHNGKALPPAQLMANAELDGSNAKIQTTLKAGDNASLKLSGLMPLTSTGLLDLRATGLIELKLLDPLLAAEGRRARGQITINGGVDGSLSAPQLTGIIKLSKVECRDYAIGANLTAINGVIKANGGQLVADKIQGEAGGGSITVSGTADVFKAGVPVDISIVARDAKPLASDRLTANLNADLTVRGLAAENVLVMGAIKINRADIRIPEYLPANIAVLKVIKPGDQLIPPASKQSDIHLNVVISAFDEVFVRGRGVDAELDGTVHVRGSLGQPQANGGFKLRRGQYMLGGKTLAFSQGKVGFDGSQLTDPSLYLVANSSSNNVTATLTIAGAANKPKIILSSVPDLPQDEVLARLLFNRSSSNLSVLELLQIGSAVAALSGATSSFGDPLDDVRKTLGLDRLTVGGKKTSVEAGSYVVPGVYLGTRQGLSGGPQATIQIDVTKNIKLEAAVGANSASNKNANPNSLGVIYQFEY